MQAQAPTNNVGGTKFTPGKQAQILNNTNTLLVTLRSEPHAHSTACSREQMDDHSDFARGNTSCQHHSSTPTAAADVLSASKATCAIIDETHLSTPSLHA